MAWTHLPVAVLALVVVIALGVALAAPLYVLLLFDLMLSLLPARWEVAGVLLDPTDIVFGALLVGAAVRARRAPEGERTRIPFFALWLLLGCWISLSYLRAPSTQQYLTGPLEIAYQLYRYCWKGLLYYPMAVLLLGPLERRRKLVLVVIVTGVLFSIQSIPGGYAGSRGGPILEGNALGLALHCPLFATLGVLATTDRRRVKIASMISLLLIVRAITFSGSRGAFVADMVGALVLFGLLATLPSIRPRLARLGVAAAVLFAVLMVVVPDLSERPTIQRFRTVTSLQTDEDSTLNWRMEERWPHFWNQALARPWLGAATAVDSSLGASANTPHNGYLSLAVSHGFPALAIVLFFGWLGVRNCLRLVRGSDDSADRIFGAVGAASLMALLIHNVVDDGFALPFTAKLFWAFTGLAVAAARRRLATEGSPAESTELGFPQPLSEAGVGRPR